MTDKNRREEYDEIIKMSIEMNKENDDELKELTDEDVIKMGYELPPDDMYDRIIKAAEKEAPFRKKKTHIKKPVLLVAIIAVIAIVGVVSGVKHYSFDIDGEVTENAIEFRGTNKNDYVYEADESAAYKSAEEALGTSILKPTYLPEGFKFDRIKIYNGDYIYAIYRNESKMIKIEQKLLLEKTTSGKISDESYGNLYTFNFDGKTITAGEQTQLETNEKWIKAVWKDDKLAYMINSNCSKEELEKFIKSLK